VILPTIWSAMSVALLGLVTASAGADEKKEAIYFGKTVHDWAAQLKSKDRTERLDAAGNLGLIGAEANSAIPNLVEAARDEDGMIAMLATNTLARIGPAALPSLTEFLVDEDKETRRRAACAIALMGPTAKPAIDTLVECLKDKDEATRKFAAHALGMIGSGAESAVPNLANALESDIREWAADALCRIGPNAKAAVPTLIKLLHDVAPEPRVLAARVLADIGPNAKDAVPALIDVLKLHGEERIPSRPGFGDGGGFGRPAAVTPIKVVLSDALKKIDPVAAKKAGVK
jgi:HEAT repeat protein